MKKILETLKQKWSEYLLEMLVITIGILGAFALNNWNQQINEGHREQKLLSQILTDYEANLHQLENKISQRNTIMEGCIEMLEVIQEDTQVKPDTLSKRFATFLLDPTFNPIENDFISSGSIRLLKNDSLKKIISQWNSMNTGYQELEQMQHNHLISVIIPFLKRADIMRNTVHEFWDTMELQSGLTDQGRNANSLELKKNKKKVDVERILKDPELENLLSFIFHMSRANNMEAETLKRKMLKTIEILNNEIER